MVKVATDLTPLSLATRPHLVSHTGDPASKPGLVIELGRGRATVEGEPIGPPAALIGPKSDPIFRDVHPASLVYLAIDGATRWRAIHTTLKALRSRGLRRVAFVLDSRASATAPAPSALDARLSAGARAGDVLARVYRHCGPARSAIADAMTRFKKRQEQAARLAQTVPAAVLECGCEPDQAAVRSVHWFQFGSRSGRTYSAVQVWLNLHDPSSGALGPDTVAFTGQRLWREIAAEVIAKASSRPLFGLRVN
jgi:hypothetical protein